MVNTLLMVSKIPFLLFLNLSAEMARGDER